MTKNKEIKEKVTISFRCPCGKRLIRTNKTTDRWECPNEDCRVIYDKDFKKVWVGKPIL